MRALSYKDERAPYCTLKLQGSQMMVTSSLVFQRETMFIKSSPEHTPGSQAPFKEAKTQQWTQQKGRKNRNLCAGFGPFGKNGRGETFLQEINLLTWGCLSPELGGLATSARLESLCVCVCVCISCSVVSDFELMEPTRLIYPWDFPGKNTGVGSLSLLQGIFLTQGSNPGLLQLQADSLPPGLPEIHS